MVAKVTTEPPTKKQIGDLIRAATTAPNHHLTQPWRFVVLTGKSLDDLGEKMAQRIYENYKDDPGLEQKVEVERARPHRAPVIIAVIFSPPGHPKAIDTEERYAVGAAIQNMLLWAHAEGLGAYWRTGPAAEYGPVKEWLGLKDTEEIAGFIYVGYPDPEQKVTPTARRPIEEVTSWI